ncbi:MAG TPA: O-antigen ligase family protein [Dongiaceae bacterium]|nr:O-antigen ligase family protein [Dongiaceae bacterium]
MKPAPPVAAAPDRLAVGFQLLLGAFLGLALLKFGNPSVLEDMVARPTNGYEWALSSWPASIGHGLLVVLVIFGILVVRWKTRAPGWLICLPLLWLAWQLVAATHTVDAALTSATVKHFVACVACFYLGLGITNRCPDPLPFFAGLVLGLIGVVIVGWQQHFGGLEATRRYFFLYIYPQMASVPPELLKKMSNTRIFSTLFYPNALAGVILLLLPASLTALWRMPVRMTPAARGLLVGLLAAGALACLYWSGSKGGWLLLLFLGLLALLRLPFPRKWKLALMLAVLAVGLTGFAVKFAGYFKKGATSVTARFDYWQAAGRTALAHPVFGTGPGTFAIPYKQIKRPESEMARLVHNDYLEQASDSGFIGAMAYLAFIGGALWVGFRNSPMQGDWMRFCIGLGLLGWALQSFMEFGLYIPATAWTAFCLFGWLLGSRNPVDSAPKTG